MTLTELRDAAKARLDKAQAEAKRANDTLAAYRAAVDSDETITAEKVAEAIEARDAAKARVSAVERDLESLEAEIREDAKVAAAEAEVRSAAPRPAYDEVARVGSEERTYALHKEPGFDSRSDRLRPGIKPGGDFERDVAAAFFGDWEAQQRLARHQQEERAERGDQLTRAAGTGAFAGLVVPQYLTDMYAPAVAAMRPFADVCNKHPLPATGMTVNLSRITTATSAAIQASENSSVSETNIDDTLLTINIQTAAGQQTLSRQAIERGTGVEAVTLDDLFRRYASVLDSTLLNQATNGLTNVATSIAYTDASPTVAEFLPDISQAAAAVETALLDKSSGDRIAVMHSRRWFWLQQALSSTFPIIAQPPTTVQAAGVNLGETYGRGFRGILPNAIPAITDNNIATNLGVGTNQDEVYVVDRNECHLWEDPSAPMFIRAEQPAAASLGVLLVVYGYFAYTHARYSHAQKIGGTGLVTPTWTGA